MNKQNKLDILFIIAFSLVFNLSLGYGFSDKNFWLFVLLILNGSINLISLILSTLKQSLSLNFFINFFFYLFFFIIPLIHYHFNHFNYFNSSISTYKYAEYSLLCLFIFNLIYSISFQKNRNQYYLFFEVKETNSKPIVLWILISISILVLLSVGFSTLLLRNNSFSKSSSDSMLKVMSFAFFFRPLLFFVAIIEWKKKRKMKKKFDITLIILFLCAVMFNLPTSTARFYTLFIVIVFITTIFFKKTTSNFIIPTILLSSVNFSFFFSNLRFLNSILDLNTKKFKFDIKSFIDSIHFDAFEVSMLAIRYVERFGFTFGENIFGAFLFFVPRNIWGGKPEPSGTLIINNQININSLEDSTFTNISFPLISEFYIAFGIIGIVILALALKKISNYLDFIIRASFNQKKDTFSSFDLNIMLVSSIIGLSIFILRGSLMVAFAYSISILLSFFVAIKLCGIRYRFKL